MVNNIVVIKAGSSVFQNKACFETVADMIVPIVRDVDQVYFVVSALKGETDRTIDRLAREEAEISRGDTDALRTELNNALQAIPSWYDGRFNKVDIAEQLVQPENYSALQLTGLLQQRGITAKCFQHGPTYPIIGFTNRKYVYATPNRFSTYEAMRDLPEVVPEHVVVIPGFGVRDILGNIMCTGRGSSDMTALIVAEMLRLQEVIYWKDSGGIWRDPSHPEQGILTVMNREEAKARRTEKVLDERVYNSNLGIRVTMPGQITGGTYIQPPLSVFYPHAPDTC